ncbi:MAG: hypothetical protein LBT86_00690 [Deltaproteobacteria bacterium]|nr:hypothetical protein [Deltaproteobacteria bacterium]
MIIKLFIVILLCLVIYYPRFSFAQNELFLYSDDIPTVCNFPGKEFEYKICSVAKSMNAPTKLVTMIYLLFNAEETATLCSFKLSNKYNEMKSLLSEDQDIKIYYEIKRIFSNNITNLLNKFTQESYCEFSYKTLGSSNSDTAQFFD